MNSLLYSTMSSIASLGWKWTSRKEAQDSDVCALGTGGDVQGDQLEESYCGKTLN